MLRIQSAYIIAQGTINNRCPVYSSLFYNVPTRQERQTTVPRLRFYNCISFSVIVNGILSEIFSNKENDGKVVPVFIAVLASAHPHAACHETVTRGGGGGKALTMTMTPWNLTHGQWSKNLTMTTDTLEFPP